MKTKHYFFFWGAAFSAILIGIGDAVLTSPAKGLEVNEPICYMQRPDGSIQDLSHFCRTSSTASGGQVVISRTQREANFLLGNVVNRTGKAVRNVRVNYEAIAPNGSVVDRGVVIADPGNLAPGQTGIFEVGVEPGLSARATTVLWDE